MSKGMSIGGLGLGRLVVASTLFIASVGCVPPRPPTIPVPPVPPPTLPPVVEPSAWDLDVGVLSDVDGLPLVGVLVEVECPPSDCGDNDGRTERTDTGGMASFPDLQQAGMTVCASAEFWERQCRPVTLTGDRRLTFRMEPASRLPAGRTGPVRASGAAFADDGGEWNALGTTLFWALWGERHDPDKLERNLAFLSGKVDFVRILAMVGAGDFWADRVIDPAWDDYWSVVDRLFERLARHGLRAEVTIFADAQVMMPGDDERREFADVWAQYADAHAGQVMFLEVANEYNGNGFADRPAFVAELASQINQTTDVLVAPSAPLGTWPEVAPGQQPTEAQRWTLESWRGLFPNATGSDVVTQHYDRDNDFGDMEWRPVRQPWETQFTGLDIPQLWVNNEPIGPKSSGADDTQTVTLVQAMVNTYLSSVGAYVYHTGAGICGGSAGCRARGRADDLWDVANVDETLLQFNRVRALLPDGLANWESFNGHWDGHPCRVETDALEDDLVRIYAAVQGGVAVIAPIGVRRDVSCVMEVDGRIFYPPYTDGVDVSAGERITIRPPAALIVGRQ